MTTINIDLLSVLGIGVSTQVTFTMLRPPLAISGAIVLPVPQSVLTASDGTGTVALEAGWYLVTFPVIDMEIVIQVPYTGPVNLADIVSSLPPNSVTTADIADATTAGRALLTGNLLQVVPGPPVLVQVNIGTPSVPVWQTLWQSN
jgi:hypothetical protein